MKHIILSIICILGTFISQCYAKETATVALVHNGAIVKTYTGPSDKNNCLKEALEDAEEGDSIFLGYGVFYLQKIDKSIAIIGMGDITGLEKIQPFNQTNINSAFNQKKIVRFLSD